MSDPFDRLGPHDNPEYWDALASRVAARATRRLAPLGWLAEAPARWLAVSLALAALLLLALVPAAGERSGTYAVGLTLVPPDAVGRALASRDAPPAIAALLVANQVQGSRR